MALVCAQALGHRPMRELMEPLGHALPPHPLMCCCLTTLQLNAQGVVMRSTLLEETQPQPPSSH